MRARLAMAIAGALAVLAAHGPAAAHAVLVTSAPAARAVLASPPARVELTFSERLEPAYSRATVWDARGAQVDLRDAAVAQDRRRLTVSLPPLAPGRYTVRYRVLSIDGHVVEAEFVFTVGPGAGRSRP
jgi:methionine-rich copper-binding protein CopC